MKEKGKFMRLLAIYAVYFFCWPWAVSNAQQTFSQFFHSALHTELKWWNYLVCSGWHIKPLKVNITLSVLSSKSLEVNAKMNIFGIEVKGKTDTLDM